MAETKFKESIRHDLVHSGVRIVVGSIFIAHSLGKFNPGFSGFLNQIGIATELQYVIAFAEVLSGGLLIVGILSRISSSVQTVILLGVIFHVKHASSLTGQGGFELELLLLASAISIIIVGPGRISLSYLIKKLPRYLH